MAFEIVGILFHNGTSMAELRFCIMWRILLLLIYIIALVHLAPYSEIMSDWVYIASIHIFRIMNFVLFLGIFFSGFVIFDAISVGLTNILIAFCRFYRHDNKKCMYIWIHRVGSRKNGNLLKSHWRLHIVQSICLS